MTALRSAVRPLATAQYSIASTSRAASTSAPSQPAASTSTSTESKPATTRNGALPLSWPAYLALRHKRRVYSQVASVPTTIASLVASASYFGNLEADPTQTIFGVEPIFAYIGATMGCTGLGYLAGPTFGSMLFKLTNSRHAESLEVMDKAFYEHIKARRVDPSYQSVNNPTPDYYGEKISSLASYRRWLRDQAAYRRKALHGMQEELL